MKYLPTMDIFLRGTPKLQHELTKRIGRFFQHVWNRKKIKTTTDIQKNCPERIQKADAKLVVINAKNMPKMINKQLN